VAHQVVHHARPRAGGPADRAADAHRPAHVAARQPLTVEQPVADGVDEGDVGRQPAHVAHVLGTEPAHRVVLAGQRLTGAQPADVRAELDLLPERHRTGKRLDHLDLAAQLLTDLADEGLLGTLAGLDLPAGELPPAGQGRRHQPPRGQQPAVAQHRRPDHASHRHTVVGRVTAAAPVLRHHVP
jgi:hypothetical protein